MDVTSLNNTGSRSSGPRFAFHTLHWSGQYHGQGHAILVSHQNCRKLNPVSSWSSPKTCSSSSLAFLVALVPLMVILRDAMLLEVGAERAALAAVFLT